jgi:SAM-dependent methyltransferase
MATPQTKLDTNYWQARYENEQTAWDIGKISTPLKSYFDTLQDKELRILIPGAGNAYEAEYLHQMGFSHVFVIDLTKAALQNLRQRCPSFPESHCIQGDFFEHKPEQKYDIIVEQTFFCALEPHLRNAYVEQMLKLLSPKGILVGVLFADVRLEQSEPPFGAEKVFYERLFAPHFRFIHFEKCKNSIPQRQGSELFIEFMPLPKQAEANT